MGPFQPCFCEGERRGVSSSMGAAHWQACAWDTEPQSSSASRDGTCSCFINKAKICNNSQSSFEPHLSCRCFCGLCKWLRSMTFSPFLHEFARAAITKCDWLGSLNIRNLFSHGSEGPEVPYQGGFILRPVLLACRWLPSRCVLTWSLLCEAHPWCLCAPRFLFLVRLDEGPP